MFKAGFIRKIEVRNFVTYDYVEMYPGPNLNMIIGPNGTGKSTMVAAIILGLGGNPRTVGRGSRISEYVKHGCDKATINIYLQKRKDDSFLQITREFDKAERSYWRLNGEKCLLTDISVVTKKFNIQVDNLCQFLPQDRVADFAKLNKKDLLKNTQIALGREDLINKQSALVAHGENHKHLLDLSKKYAQKLQEAKDANSRLEGKVASFNKMIEYRAQIKQIDRKIAWVMYEEKRAQLAETKEDKVRILKIVDHYKTQLRPMEKLLKECMISFKALQHKHTSIMQNIRDIEEKLDGTGEKIGAVSSKARDIEDDISNKINEIEQWNRQIEEAVAKLEEMKKSHNTALEKISQSEREKEAISNEMTKCTTVMRQLRGRKDAAEQETAEEVAELNALQSELNRIENIRQSRLELLRRSNEDAYRAVLWLTDNKHIFKGEVFEPIMLELNILDPTKAKYLESIIAMRDRLAFTCTDKSDMNLLIESLREKQGLSVNVLHSSSDTGVTYSPRIPIEQLRKYGFYTYVNMLISAPKPIANYLCRTYRLHEIPIGDNSTNTHYEHVPRHLTLFFSDKFRFAINYSKYTNEKSTRQNEIVSDGGFSLFLDVVRLENIRGRCEDKQKKIRELVARTEQVKQQIDKIEDSLRIFKDKLLENQKQKHQADMIKTRIEMAQQNIKSMRTESKSPEAIRQEAKATLEKLTQTMELLQEKLKSELAALQEKFRDSQLNTLKLEWVRQKMEHSENEMSDVSKQLKDAEDNFNVIHNKYSALMQEAKAQLQKAKGLSNGFTPADDGFDEFREKHDQLTDNTEELNEQKESISSKMACLVTADDGELEEYEKQRKQIDNLTRNIESNHQEFEQIEGQMARMREEWLDPLNQLITEINTRFASSFERMGCAGEVAVCHGQSENDYEDYGISIKVTYRNGEPLQELNSTVQSGGERAVATAVYMLSLQDLTPVPFRCVDEINQGMDVNNERRIFELIVETTCQPDTSQYFLITPKLVPNLEYSKQVMVHIIHNGPFINENRKWGFSKLCNPQAIK